jgi:hypothetical protein
MDVGEMRATRVRQGYPFFAPLEDRVSGEILTYCATQSLLKEGVMDTDCHGGNLQDAYIRSMVNFTR